MISGFTFARTPKIYFGSGKFNEINKIIAGFGQTVLLVTGAKSLKNSGKLDNLLKSFENYSIDTFLCSIHREPSPDLIDEIVSEFKENHIDVVLAIGGGSVIDAGKAISAMLLQQDSVLNYLEGIGTKDHNGVKIPFIATPTTAGTGSEATKNAVLSQVGPDGFKKSLRHDNLVPDVAVIDPELARSCPPKVTAACGMDAFTQLLESYVSSNASPMTDALAYSGIKYLKDNLVPAYSTNADDVQVRAAMAYASLISGITLANAGLGIVHGLASPIGGFFDIPHGVVCGTLIGEATKVNIEYLKNKTGSDDSALQKYAEIGRLVSGSDSQNIKYCCNLLIEQIDEWTELLELPHLNEYGINASDLDKIIEKTANKNNPIRLGKKEIKKILVARM